MRVSDVMTRAVATCRATTDLATAGRRMAEVGCGVLPVIDGTGQVIAVITDRDLGMALAAGDRRPSELKVAQAMSREAFTCRTDDDLGSALATMRTRRVRRLPAVDATGRVAGMLSLDDVARHARAIETEGFTGPLYADVALTLRAVVRDPPAALVA